MPTIRRTANQHMTLSGTGLAGVRRRFWSRATELALCTALFAVSGGYAVAQREASRILVAPAILAEPASQVPLAILVGPPGALPSNSFVRLRGLPGSVSLSDGHAIAPGSWAVPLFALPSLKAIVPAGVSGRTEIIIHLVSMDGTTLAEARTALIVGPTATMIAPAEKKAAAEPPPQRPALPQVSAPAAQPLQARPAELTPEAKDRAERLILQGDRHLEQGNIGAARLFYQRAAEAGLPAGAIKMAATYDPTELERLNVRVQGVAADRAEARKWYERARTLGASDAEERLTRLGGGS
jgi:hypothetical protein